MVWSSETLFELARPLFFGARNFLLPFFMSKINEQEYWTNRYNDGLTGWDLGTASTPIRTYIDQLEDKDLKILIPGAGNAHEAEYLFKQGFLNVHILDISLNPLHKFKMRNPSFPNEQLIHDDFFNHHDKYDLILEQTFFCSFLPTKKNREKYAFQMNNLLNTSGKLVGVWFNHELVKNSTKRPFGGSQKEYLEYFSPFFKHISFEKCCNSNNERKELFGILRN